MTDSVSVFDHGSQADRIARQVMSNDEARAVAEVYEAARLFVDAMSVDDIDPRLDYVYLQVDRAEGQRFALAVAKALGYVG